MPVRRSNSTPASSSPSPSTSGAAADGDEHQVGLHRLAVAEVDGELRAVVLDLRALLAELERDAALPELLRELLRGVSVLLRDERVEHLDDRHLAAEAVEDRGELAADDAAAEDDEPASAPGPARAGRSSRRSAASRARRSAGAAGTSRSRRSPSLKVTSSPPSTAIVFASLKRPDALDPLDAVRLEEARDALRHLLDDAGLPRVRGREVELRLADLDAELREALLGLLERERGLHPRLRRDAPDAQARAAELGLLLDAGDLRAELGGADRGGVAAGAASEDGDVNVHSSSP